LLRRLYPTLPLSPGRAKFYLESFYKAGLSEIDAYHFSHIPRINTTIRIKDFFTDSVEAHTGSHDSIGAFCRDLPENFLKWHHLSRAQYLEAKSLLAGYLLSSQGDRVSAGHSIEGRFPFLDHRVVEFAATIPPLYKIFGLNEKFLLKRAMQNELPKQIVDRVKQPYMAPDSNSFAQADSPGYIDEMLSESSLKRTGIFNPVLVAKLRKKCVKLSHAHLSFKDNMSFIGILSTQLLHNLYVESFDPPEGLPKEAFKVWHDDSRHPGSE
jgi:asparagine synthase (glutamine-hydrolysing)